MVTIVFHSASSELKAAVSDLLAGKMGGALASLTQDALDDEAACNAILYAAGYSSTMIFHLGAEARAMAQSALRARRMIVIDTTVVAELPV